jgi:hypothetical protein
MPRSITLIAAGLVAAAVIAGAPWRRPAIPFTASYSGRVTEKVVDDSVTGTVAGRKHRRPRREHARRHGQGLAVQRVLAPERPGTIKSGKGNIKITIVTAKSRACAVSEDDRNHINVTGQVKVNGGTGKYAGASGLLTIKGQYNRSTGQFTVKFSGSLKY